MNDFAEKFRQLETDLINEQRRISVNSCLKVFFGITTDKYYRISFISSTRPLEIESTKQIKVTQGKESDEVYWTCFDLISEDAKEVFFVFCDSLISSIDNVFEEYEALADLKERYYAWRLLFRNKGKMPYELYQGLFGELYFLSEYLAKQVGIDAAINAWVGPDGYSKDFSINSSWYEIKTIGTSSESVKINSLAQLDSEVNGHLVVLVVERMSDQYDSGICSVSILYHSILDSINDHQMRETFINKTLKYGYSDEDESLNNQKFEMKNISSYCVDKQFPKLTRKNIRANAISQVSYDLTISAINEYLEEIK